MYIQGLVIKMMKKNSWSWPRFWLWMHVIGVVAFYLILWKRTAPAKEDKVRIIDREDEAETSESDHPLVSIVVPARNEERNIRRCVESLLAQDYANFEVIAVDDGSTDATAHILNEI